MLFVVLALGPRTATAQYTDFVWKVTAGNAEAAASWTNNVVPMTNDPNYAMNWIITNNLAVSASVTINANYQINNFIATNTGTALRSIHLEAGLTLQAHGTSIIGSNTLFNISRTSAGNSTFSNNHLFLQDNAILQFNGNVVANGTLASRLFVDGNFTNSSQSLIRAAGPAILKFTSPTVAITNAGTMYFVHPFPNGAYSPALILTVGANSNAFFHNSGTFIVGFDGWQNAAQSVFVISNQFNNTGFFVVTNHAVGSGSANTFPIVTFTGSSGGASTNAGTIRMTMTGTGRPSRPVGTLTFANGNFINRGTLTFHSISNDFSGFVVAENGAVFSNAAGGQVIMEAGGTGTFSIKADTLVNLGTNLLNAGTLQYRNAANGSGILQNPGTILFAGGFLDVNVLTNRGVLLNTGDNFVWLTGNTLHNVGVIDAGAGMFTNRGALVLGSGTVFGLVTNMGTVSVTNGTATLAGTLLNGGHVNLFQDGLLTGGTVTNLAGATLSFTGGALDTPLYNFGVINATNGWGTLGYITNAGTINLRSSGTLVAGVLTNYAGSTLNAVAGGNLSNFVLNLPGGVVNATNGLFNIFGGLYNSAGATLNTRSTGTNTFGGILTNAGVIAAVAGGVFNNGLENTGVVLATNGTLAISGPVTGTGLFQTSNGSTLALLGGGMLDLPATVFYTNGTLMLGGTFINSQAGPATPVGTLVITNGTLFHSAYDNVILGADAANNSTLIVANAGNLYVTNAVGTAQLVIGRAGRGVLNVREGGYVAADQLLLTNVLAGGLTNALILGTAGTRGGTLTTSNAALAADVVFASNTTLTLNGTWNMNGGTHVTRSASSGANPGTVAIGSGVSNAAVYVSPLAIWMLATNGSAALPTLYVGNSTATGNVLTLDGGTLTNLGSTVIGNGSGAFPRGNTVLLTNGARAFGSVFVGTRTFSNTLIIAGGNGVSIWDAKNTVVQVNAAAGGGGGGNILRVEAGGVLTNALSISIGNAVNVGNQLIIANGGAVQNNGVLVLGNAVGCDSNSVLITGGVLSNAGTITLGQNGGFGNFIRATNANVWSFALTIGLGSTNNSVTVLADTTWNNLGGALAIGSSGAVGNRLTIDGGGVARGAVVTNVLNISIGSGVAGGFGTLLITNGGALFSRSTVAVSAGTNLLKVVGPASFWNLAASELRLGTNGNRLVVDDGALVNGVTTLTVGYLAGSAGNQLLLTNGGQLVATTVIVNSNNTAQVLDGALLEANTLTVGAGGGNSFSNRNATFQFTTGAPAITGVSLDSGTVSFRAITNATVNALPGLTYAGNNTLMLNAATNAAAGQTYTFQTGTNYANLALINGTTAYRGGDITIGATGSLLVSNTTATFTGLFTNNGVATIANSTAIFSNGVINAGVLTLQSGTVTGNVTSTGILQGNGTLRGNTTVAGLLNPGFSPGAITNAGNFTMTEAAISQFEIATNALGPGQGWDYLFVTGNLSLSGRLDVVLLNGFVPGAADSFLIMTNTGTLFGTAASFSNVVAGTVAALSNNVVVGTFQVEVGAQSVILDNFVAVPEPSALLLVAGGLILLCRCRRRL